MRKLLIVDDEKFIRKGLRFIVEDLDSEFKQIFEARNGNEALEMIASERIELIITDICMPGMNGLDLIKEAQELTFKPWFIILSGYDDFQYAKEAIKFGACEYLLKPVQYGELYEAVKKVEKELRKADLARQINEKANVLISKFREDELKLIFLDENLTEREIQGIVSAISLEVLNGSFYITVLKRLPTNTLSEAIAGADNWNSELQLNVLADKYFRACPDSRMSYLTIKGDLVLITDGDFDVRGFTDYLKDKTGDGFAAGVSQEGRQPSDIKNAYLQASEALKYRVLKNGEGIVNYSDISHLNTIFSIPTDSIEKIPQILGTGRLNDLNDLLYGIFKRNDILENHISYLENIVACINTHVIQYFAKNMSQKTSSLAEQQERLRNIYNFNSVNDYYHTFRAYLMEINEFILALKETYNEKNAIDKAVAFIRENYAKDLSMTIVSNHVSLNYTYFSYLFMEHLGMSFVDFLKKVRVEKAMELLKDSNYKIQTISEKVGFKDPKYFAKIFRAITGISPAEYRDKPTF